MSAIVDSSVCSLGESIRDISSWPSVSNLLHVGRHTGLICRARRIIFLPYFNSNMVGYYRAVGN
jgi:hypothetical protein